MSGQTGTHDITSLLAATNQSAADFGLDTIAEVLRRDLEVHNALMRQALGEFADVTQDRQRIAGGSTNVEMKEVDEYGRAATQRMAKSAQVGFPLTLFQSALGWTRTWERERTPADFARATIAAEKAHRRVVLREIKRALYRSANYTHVDDLVDNISFGVKRLVNGDGDSIPEGPNGETFNGATHTHYMANAGLNVTVATALIDTVVEHGHGTSVRVYINKADEAAWRALTGFVAYSDPRIILATNANAARDRLDISRMDNRAIGIFGAAEVWVKPWAIASYPLAFDVGTADKPLVVRERTAGSMDLQIVAEIDAHPLVARYMEAKFGVGVWTRTNGAVLYTAAGAYTDPTINS